MPDDIHRKPDWTPPEREPGPLTEADVREIRRALALPICADAEEIMAHFGISRSMVSAIKCRRVWKHIDPPTMRGNEAARLRLGSYDGRRGQKARMRSAMKAWDMVTG